MTDSKAKAADLIYKTLKEEILQGKIQPGTLLSETEIAKRFSVSRTPVREALNQLASIAMVDALPQRGHLVHTITFSEVLETFRLRELLEVEAAGEAAQHITPQDIAAMEDILHNTEDKVLMNYRFHMMVAETSKNRLLSEFIEKCLQLLQRLIILHPTLLDISPEIKIIDALKSKDSEQAREAMRSHIHEARDNLIKALYR